MNSTQTDTVDQQHKTAINQDVRLEYLEEDEMKRRIGSAIAGVSLLISCVCVGTGCTPALGYVTIDWGRQ